MPPFINKKTAAQTHRPAGKGGHPCGSMTALKMNKNEKKGLRTPGIGVKKVRPKEKQVMRKKS